MKVYNTNQLAMYDVDDTLVMHELHNDKSIGIPDPYIPGMTNFLTPNEKHITLLKKHKARGFTVVVWSQQGFEWAEAVVKALKLEEYVDAVFTKPSVYVDDLDVNAWFGQRVYLK